MTCLTELVCSMHADGALEPAEAAEAERHLRRCRSCRERVAALAGERQLLAAAMAEAPAPERVPALRRPTRRREALWAAALLAALAAGPLVLARILADLGAPALLAWLNPIAAAALVDLGVDAVLSLISRGDQIMASITQTIGSGVFLALVAWGAFAAIKRRGGGVLLASLALCVLVAPRPSEALEVRRSEDQVTVPASETIDDTLIAFGDRVEVDGTVTGDLVAFARRIVVRGRVDGQLVTFARNVTVDGSIGQGVVGFAQSLELGQADVARNFFGFGQSVTTYADAHVGENAVLFGQNLELAGPVDRDVMGFGEMLDVRGNIGGDLTARGNRLTVEAPASVGGNVLAYLPSEDNLDVSSGATIGGSVRTEIAAIEMPRNRYARVGFYFGQLVRIAAAFVAGLILLAIVPSLRRTSLDDTMAGLAAAGIGLVAMVAAPIIGVIVAITVVGIPVAVIGVLLWLVGLYFAKIVLAHFVGRRLLDGRGEPRHFAVALLVGLLLTIVAVNLPFIGGIVNFLLTITGLGMLVIWLWHVVDKPSTGGSEPAAA